MRAKLLLIITRSLVLFSGLMALYNCGDDDSTPAGTPGTDTKTGASTGTTNSTGTSTGIPTGATAGTSTSSGVPTGTPTGSAMTLTSTAFNDLGNIPVKYCNVGVSGGFNISIPLKWTGAPTNTKSFALQMIDRWMSINFIHWLVINITSTVNELAEGVSTNSMPAGCNELNNDFGMLGYGGPEPPVGSGIHDYEIIIHALSVTSLTLATSTTLAQFESAISGNVLTQAKLTGKFSR